MRIPSFPIHHPMLITSRVHAVGTCLLMALFVMLLTPVTTFCADQPLIKTHIRVSSIQSAFLGSNENDAATAFKSFARIIGKQKGYDMEISISTFKDVSQLMALPEDKRPHIVILGSWSFLKIEKEGWLTPIATTSIGEGQACSPYQILVPEDSTAQTIEDLRGKTINILFRPQTQIGVPWLRSILATNNLGTLDSFFADTLMENDPMKAILPVFFGQRDAGLIPTEKFQLMAELNPQLNKMRAIAVSKPLIRGITSFNRKGWDSPKIKQDMIDAILELHLSPIGQQILHLFKTDRIIAYQPKDMDTVRAVGEILSGTHP